MTERRTAGRPRTPHPPVTDEELKAVARRIPAVIQAAKATGGPVHEEVRALLGANGLGPRHLHALAQVLDGGPMSVSALGARLGVALPTASLVVTELSRAGLLERIEDEQDHRRTIVSLAPEKALRVERFLELRLGPLRRALVRLTVSERAALARGLEVLAEELNAGAVSPAVCALEEAAGPAPEGASSGAAPPVPTGPRGRSAAAG